MEQCSEDDDWLRREIREALEKRKNIICVFINDFKFPDKLPADKEVELTCFTESRLYTEVEKFINSHNSYELCQLICVPIINISKEFGNWIYSYTGKIKFED